VPEIVWINFGHASCVARRSATIVPDNRLALPPSLAVGRNCSRQLCDTPAVHGGRIQQSILPPRALLARRSNPLVVAYFILTRALRMRVLAAPGRCTVNPMCYGSSSRVGEIRSSLVGGAVVSSHTVVLRWSSNSCEASVLSASAYRITFRAALALKISGAG
jgi:hypothetical protein